jgi:hypothetical protein
MSGRPEGGKSRRRAAMGLRSQVSRSAASESSDDQGTPVGGSVPTRSALRPVSLMHAVGAFRVAGHDANTRPRCLQTSCPSGKKPPTAGTEHPLVVAPHRFQRALVGPAPRAPVPAPRAAAPRAGHRQHRRTEGRRDTAPLPGSTRAPSTRAPSTTAARHHEHRGHRVTDTTNTRTDHHDRPHRTAPSTDSRTEPFTTTTTGPSKQGRNDLRSHVLGRAQDQHQGHHLPRHPSIPTAKYCGSPFGHVRKGVWSASAGGPLSSRSRPDERNAR